MSESTAELNFQWLDVGRCHVHKASVCGHDPLATIDNGLSPRVPFGRRRSADGGRGRDLPSCRCDRYRDDRPPREFRRTTQSRGRLALVVWGLPPIGLPDDRRAAISSAARPRAESAARKTSSSRLPSIQGTIADLRSRREQAWILCGTVVAGTMSLSIRPLRMRIAASRRRIRRRGPSRRSGPRGRLLANQPLL